MRHLLCLLTFAALLPAQTPPPGAPQAKPDEIVLTIGDRKFTAADYELLVRTLFPKDQQPWALGPGRRAVAQRMVGLFSLADEAARQHLDQRPDIARQLDFQRENLLHDLIFNSIVNNAVVSDADVQAYYDAHKSEFEVINARHILIRVKGSPIPGIPGRPELTDEEALSKAKAIRKRLLAGEDFAIIAKSESDDTTSAMKGGDLGEERRNKTVPQFEEAAFALKPGEISEPVKTPFGYHIIQVQSHSFRSLADVKAEIVERLKPEVARRAVTNLIDQAHPAYNEGFFGGPSGEGPK